MGAGFTDGSQVALPSSPFGSFKRIEFCFRSGSFCGNVGRQIAVPIFPFERRSRACGAVPTG